MVKSPGAALALVALMALAVWGEWISISSRHIQVPQRQAETSGKEHLPINALWDWIAHDAISFFTAVLAVFTASLAIVAIIQIRYLIRANNTARDTVDAMERNARKQLRAYVCVETIPDKLPVLSEKEGMGLALGAWNRGQTPAFEATMWCNIGIAPYPLGKSLPPIRHIKDAPKVIIGPNAKLVLAAYDKTLTELEMGGLRAGVAKIYMWGEVRYRDAFGHPHFTRFQVRFGPPSDPFGGLEFCGEGNDAD